MSDESLAVDFTHIFSSFLTLSIAFVGHSRRVWRVIGLLKEKMVCLFVYVLCDLDKVSVMISKVS